jgi:hypothetical protein
LTIALLNDQGRVSDPDGHARPTKALLGIGYTTGEYAEDTLPGVTTLEEVLERLLGQLRASRQGERRES